MIRHLLATCLAVLAAAPAAAQITQSHCIALARATPGLDYVQTVAFGAPLDAETVRLNYVSHATFLIETPDGVRIATDFAGALGSTTMLPDVVTMNRAHHTHYTNAPDPRIPHVLRGWNPRGGPAEHYLTVGDTLIRNVSTDIRGRGGAVKDGNSIFVFEVAGLCIGHLGHLHHEPDAAQYAALGRLDVVMAPVDGGYTLDQPTMIRILKRLRSSVVIPMHWFGEFALEQFLAGMADDFVIDRREDSWAEVSLRGLPPRPTIVVLRPRWLEGPG
jgi:L-ascorbate metabolism protein UlaG (beta-lactamase superfamily)